MQKFILGLGASLLILTVPFFSATAQTKGKLVKDPAFLMEIPSIREVTSSPAHLYVLSEQEGLVVFRTNPDTLQWLYSSSGMQQRGNRMSADIRFAYLYGNSNRLTVIEPTSLLGVYSSTTLPGVVEDAVRLDNMLYVSINGAGLGRILLDTPSAVDSTFTFVAREPLKGEGIADFQVSGNQLFVLTQNAELHLLRHGKQQLEWQKKLSLNNQIESLFQMDKQLIGTSANGSVYQISASGSMKQLFNVKAPVDKIFRWKGRWIIRTLDKQIWVSEDGSEVYLWKDDTDAGNYITVSKDLLFLAEYNKVHRIVTETAAEAKQNVTAQRPKNKIPPLKLKPIDDVILPYPEPLLLALELENPVSADAVSFSYKSNTESIIIRGNGLYWQPQQSDIGRHSIKIIATTIDNQVDSTTFSVDVRPFNTPPRFTPVRAMKIGVEESFTLPVKAFDPDGTNRDLIRYMGVDMPQGAAIDEQTGLFSWQPSLKQTGSHTFQVIATDQYGAAASTDITLTVIEKQRN